MVVYIIFKNSKADNFAINCSMNKLKHTNSNITNEHYFLLHFILGISNRSDQKGFYSNGIKYAVLFQKFKAVAFFRYLIKICSCIEIFVSPSFLVCRTT